TPGRNGARSAGRIACVLSRRARPSGRRRHELSRAVDLPGGSGRALAAVQQADRRILELTRTTRWCAPRNVGSMARWLLKSEPDVFSYDDLVRAGREGWDGIRSYQSRNFMREMRRGEQAIFYHSNAKPPGVAGICKIVKTAEPDPTQFDPK